MPTNLAASLQLRKPQCRRYRPVAVQCYPAGMRAEQTPIAAWINSVLKDKGWTAYRWAKETSGRVNSTTIKRAVSPAYEGVTSIRILKELAVAAKVEMPALSQTQADSEVSGEVLREVLTVVLAVMGVTQPDDEDLDAGCALLKDALQFFASDPEAGDDPARARIATRALAQRFGALV